jgi:N-acetyl sugar amidotransferase
MSQVHVDTVENDTINSGGLKKPHSNMKTNKREYRICSNCVMDTSDSKILFDEKGVCDHCNDFNNNVKPSWHTDEEGRKQLEKIVAKIKQSSKGKDFNCILGMSGGVDSSYLLHLAVTELGLRPLVFHVDGGWNSELAVNNIQVMVDKLGLDLFTEVINWEEMKDFQLAFFKSGVPHIDIPQDHAFVATLYKFAHKYNIKYILNGGNISTECVRNPMEFLYYGTDMVHLNDIRKKFSTNKMETYPFSSILNHKIYLRYIKGVKVVKPLNYMPYFKEKALKLLADEYGWKPYPQKHFESRFTKFYEGYWLPERFGFDTRRVQFSSLILTAQMTREQAMEKLKNKAYNPEAIEEEFNYIATKLNISPEELRKYFSMPKKFYYDYKNQDSLFNFGAKVLKFLGVEKSIKR